MKGGNVRVVRRGLRSFSRFLPIFYFLFLFFYFLLLAPGVRVSDNRGHMAQRRF